MPSSSPLQLILTPSKSLGGRTAALKTSQEVLLKNFQGWRSGQDFDVSVISSFSECKDSNRAETKILNYAEIKMLLGYCICRLCKRRNH